MASGSTITGDGLTTMTQVVAGTDVVETPDFNNARTNVDLMLSTANDQALGTYDPTFTYGYGQGGVGVGAAVLSNLVLATGANGAFKDLQDDVQALCAFLGVTLRTNVGTDVTTGDVILADTWNNLMLNVEDCWSVRFSPASTTISTDASATFVTSWTNTLTQTTTWTFANENDCRAFFNGGGAVGVSASRTGGTASDQNTDWTNRLSALGDVFLLHDSCTSGAGTPSGVGFYELTTSYQTLVQYFGGTSPYTSDFIQVDALIDSITNPTVVTIRTQLTDADDGVIDAPVDGTLTINGRRTQPDASGSGFSFPVPTDSVGTITGS